MLSGALLLLLLGQGSVRRTFKILDTDFGLYCSGVAVGFGGGASVRLGVAAK